MTGDLNEYSLSTTLIGDISLSDKGKMAEGALSQLSIAWRARNISSAALWAHALFLILSRIFYIETENGIFSVRLSVF